MQLALANAEEIQMILTAVGVTIAICGFLLGTWIWWLQKQPSPFEKKGERK